MSVLSGSVSTGPLIRTLPVGGSQSPSRSINWLSVRLPVSSTVAVTKVPSTDPFVIAQKLARKISDVSKLVVGYEDVFKQALLAFMTKEHILLEGPPGTSKSAFARALFSAISGAKVFRVQLSKSTPEETLLGAYDIEKLRRGIMFHNTEGSIVRAHFAFLDEFKDANEHVLRSLLGVLNERIFQKGVQEEQCPLHTAVATTNFCKSTEALEAIDDRFAFRATMTPNFSMRSLLAIDHAHLKGRKLEKNQLQDDSVTLEELTLLSDVVRGASLKTRITLPDAVLLLKNLIITEYVKAAKAESKKEVYVSPRSIAKAQDVLVASAILNGRNTVTVDDLAALRYTIPKLGDQEFAYEKIFDRVCKELVSLCAPAVMEKVDILATFDTLITNLIEQGDGVMKVISPSLWERIKILLNITSIGEITVDRLKKGIEPLTFDVEGIDAYKKSLLQVLDEQRELIDQQAP